jgi:hypothetical protein
MAGMTGTVAEILNATWDDGQRYSASETKILMPRIVLGHNKGADSTS